MNVLISGGGTGGHIFPAIAIAEEIKERYPSARIHFVGAEGKMEMKKVPNAGFTITGLPIRGLQRRLTWQNLTLPYRIWRSIRLSSALLREFEPDAVIGVGGYASAPLVWVAQRKDIPTMIQEQNSYAGITNRWLGKKAKAICVAFPNMDRFFPSDRIVYTGNPVRKDVIDIPWKKQESQRFFDLGLQKTMLIFGGSLGARTLNEAVLANERLLRQRDDIQFIWQCGADADQKWQSSTVASLPNVICLPFIQRMDHAYNASDVVCCRAGALTLSELSVVGKAAVLVPSPNVSEDHQSKNATALVTHKAARLIKDQDAKEQAIKEAIRLIDDETARKTLEINIRQFAKPLAAKHIVDQIPNIVV